MWSDEAFGVRQPSGAFARCTRQRGRIGPSDELVAPAEDKAAEDCRSPKRWRVVLGVESSEPFGVRQPSGAFAHCASRTSRLGPSNGLVGPAEEKAAEDCRSPKTPAHG